MADPTPILTLSQVTEAIGRSLRRDYPYNFLLQAEILKLNFYQHSGHCYPDLVEKRDGKVVAQMRAMIWARDYQRIDQAFRHTLGQPLGESVEVLCTARLAYDGIRGLSLVISDIDPSVSLGRLERERRQCVERLKREGLHDLNKQRPLPLLPQRIAIISAATSKGYSDFLATLQNDLRRFRFTHQLFASLLQGDKASQELRNALAAIAKRREEFDCVAIIRGGGGDVGLECYNNYDLCRAIATFPLPVFTGIGHSTNSTVAEEISHSTFITPTALATFFTDLWGKRLEEIGAMQRHITTRARGILQGQRAEMGYLRRTLTTLCRSHLQQRRADLLSHKRLLRNAATASLAHARADLQRQRQLLPALATRPLLHSRKALEALAKLAEAYSPQRTLERGYSITRHAGKAISQSSQLRPGDTLVTTLAHGQVTSTVNK